MPTKRRRVVRLARRSVLGSFWNGDAPPATPPGGEEADEVIGGVFFTGEGKGRAQFTGRHPKWREWLAWARQAL